MTFFKSVLAFVVAYLLLYGLTWGLLNLIDFCFDKCPVFIAVMLAFVILSGMYALIQAVIFLGGLIAGHGNRSAIGLLGCLLMIESVFNIVHYFGLKIGNIPNWVYIIFELVVIWGFLTAFGIVAKGKVIKQKYF